MSRKMFGIKEYSQIFGVGHPRLETPQVDLSKGKQIVKTKI